MLRYIDFANEYDVHSNTICHTSHLDGSVEEYLVYKESRDANSKDKERHQTT